MFLRDVKISEEQLIIQNLIPRLESSPRQSFEAKLTIDIRKDRRYLP
jgi:hypothetical protein